MTPAKPRADFRFVIASGLGLGLLRSAPAFAAIHMGVGIAALLALLPGVFVLGILWYAVRRREWSSRLLKKW